MQHSFFIRISLHFWAFVFFFLEKICAMDFFCARSRWSRIFYMQPATNLLFILCAHNVLCSAFVQQREIHLQFIFPLHHSHSLSCSQTLQFSFATFLNSHVMLMIAANACSPHDDGFMHLFYYCASKTYHWNHIHSHFTSGNIYEHLLASFVRIVCVYKKKIWTLERKNMKHLVSRFPFGTQQR